MMNKYYSAFRSLKRYFLPIAVGLIFWSQQVCSQNDLIVTGAQTIGTATYDNVTVQSGGVLIEKQYIMLILKFTYNSFGFNF